MEWEEGEDIRRPLRHILQPIIYSKAYTLTEKWGSGTPIAPMGATVNVEHLHDNVHFNLRLIRCHVSFLRRASISSKQGRRKHLKSGRARTKRGTWPRPQVTKTLNGLKVYQIRLTLYLDGN